MIKIRLKRFGRKKLPSYRIVVINSAARRDGRPIQEVGFYNPITKETRLNTQEITKWIKCGAQPTLTVKNMLLKADVI
uniref:ribosomal protein S16 n=1 Tax=Pseudoerythrocladia kornmannii TaxID=753682 RepID=UPI001BEFF711|nr:ribosomal protein S16 [Pseudoerythrocladia kornmannii]QUE28337.1 ribosomal protein S16 [Pseudoerythrocladia kornmannii]UNJ16842.1 ribosomal protein S16 [Pseudoerythrocladia kornmannii]